MEIVKRKDVNELWEAGVNLDEACESCHRSYWYPKEDHQFYRRLQRKIDDFEKETAATKETATKRQ